MKEIIYDTIVNSKLLQSQITNLLAERFKTVSLVLSEVGYFHMCSVLFNGRNITLKLYFHPELALTYTISPNGNKKYTIKKEFEEVMKNYFFIGDIKNVISFETISVPKYKIKEGIYGPYLFIKDKLDEREEEVLVINCNIDLVIAAINNISLDSKDYTLKYNSIGTHKKPIMISASSDIYPIQIVVEYNDEDLGYKPGLAEPYIRNIIKEKKKQEQAEKKIAKKASDVKSKPSKLYKNYLKYR